MAFVNPDPAGGAEDQLQCETAARQITGETTDATAP